MVLVRSGSPGRNNHSRKQTARTESMIGCSTAGPLAWAIAPTMNGIIEAPDAPTAEQIPMADTRILCGRRRDKQTMTKGNKGPRQKPRKYQQKRIRILEEELSYRGMQR